VFSGFKIAFTAALILASTNSHALYGVNQAIKDVLADEPVYVGSFVPRYSEDGSMKMCVFRGKKTIVFMYYCTSKLVSAESLSIHSIDPKLGSVEVYAEVPEHVDVTKVKRNRYYDMNFRVSARAEDGFKFNSNMKQFQEYDDAKSRNPGAACLCTQTFPRTCKADYASEQPTWAEPAQDFWKSPGKNWYKLIKVMKSRVR
jgi:hypothetical protein